MQDIGIFALWYTISATEARDKRSAAQAAQGADMDQKIRNNFGNVRNRAPKGPFLETEDVHKGRKSKHYQHDDEEEDNAKIPIDGGDETVRNLFRDQDYKAIVSGLRPGQLFEDRRFDPARSDLLTAGAQHTVKWLRPHQIVRGGKEPRFVEGARDRFDINQGEVGNCWFLSALASLAENEKCFTRVVPMGQNDNFDKTKYRGVFRFRFFRWDA
jgi:hypothetical protein